MPGALEVIRRHLPEFWEEEAAGGMRGLVEGLKGIVGGSREQGSVMAAPSERDTVRGMVDAASPLAYAAPFVGPAFRALTTYPKITGLGLAAATGDPTMAFMSPLGLGLTYSPDADASKFTDSLKAIDRFVAAHGTPNVFPPVETNPLGAFDMSKMGTGEGAQSYMYGHYLAGDPAISRVHYRDRLVDDVNRRAIADANRQYENQFMSAVRDVLGRDVHNATAAALAKKVAAGKDLNRSLKATANEKRLDKEWLDVVAARDYDIAARMPIVGEPGSAMRNPAAKEVYDLVESMPTWEEVFSSKMIPKYAAMKKEADRMSRIMEKTTGPAWDRAYREALEKYPPSPRGHDMAVQKLRNDYARAASNQYVREAVEKLPDVEKQAFLKHATEGLETSMYGGFLSPQSSALGWLLKKARKIDATKRALENREGIEGALKTTKEASNFVEPELKQGALYTVEVGASPGTMLPLDMRLKELREDMPDVYNAYSESLQSLGQPGLGSYRGSDTPMTAWGNFPRRGAYPRRLMEELNARGVPGNLFLAKGRRQLDTEREFDPSAFNYVIFNDEVPRIVSRELGKPPVKKARGGLARLREC